MIFTRSIWLMPEATPTQQALRLNAERKHMEAVHRLCEEVSRETANAVRPLTKDLHERRVSGYARSLETFLRHLRVDGQDRVTIQRREGVKQTIVEAAHRFWFTEGAKDAPPPYVLLVRSHFAYAFPGGEELQELFGFSDAVFHAYGSTRMFEVGVGLFEAAVESGLAAVGRDADGPVESGVLRVWRRWHGEGRDADWDGLVRWMSACRQRVRMPREEMAS